MVSPNPDEQRILDAEHLRLLRIGYFISAGVTGFYALFGLVYVGMGALVGGMLGQLPNAKPAQPPPPEMVGWMFAIFGGALTCLGGAFTALKLYVARCLRERKSLALCQVTAAFNCLEIPYGTALGVFTFSVLARPSVKSLFALDRGT